MAVLSRYVKSGPQSRLLAVLLALLTLAAIGLGIANLVQETGFQLPTDGVRWSEVQGGLAAYIVPVDTPGFKAGIRQGDILTAVNGQPVHRIASLERATAASGVWSHATYSLERHTAA